MQKNRRTSLLLFIAFFVGMAVIQFSTPNLPDNDGFYHIKMAWLMRTEGLKPDFIWLPQSILNEEDFYDHHFLYHVALIPFTFGKLREGADPCLAHALSSQIWNMAILFNRQRMTLISMRSIEMDSLSCLK